MTFFDYPIYSIPEQEDGLSISLDRDLVIIIPGNTYGIEQKALLQKILRSVNQDLTEEKLFLIDKPITHFGYTEVDALVLVFDSDQLTLPIQIDTKPYQLVRVGTTTFLFAHSLKELPQFPKYRRALWTALKQYYNLT